MNEDNEYYGVSSCPACGAPIDYCQGHGDIGDPAGAAILAKHDDGDHTECHPEGCDEQAVADAQQMLDDETLVTVDYVYPYGLFDTVIRFGGVDQETGDSVTFGVDHRPARALLEALQQDEAPTVALEGWQILRRTPAEVES